MQTKLVEVIDPTVRYFFGVSVKKLPDPEGEIDRAMRLVKTAKETGTLEDLKALITDEYDF